jgi:hypothetical protein
MPLSTLIDSSECWSPSTFETCQQAKPGSLWRFKSMDFYLEVISNDNGSLMVVTSDIGRYAVKGQPFPMGIETLKAKYRPHPL